MWFTPGTPVFSTNKTDIHDIQNVTEILLKVALNTTTLTLPKSSLSHFIHTPILLSRVTSHYIIDQSMISICDVKNPLNYA
jgi:hypothetical protein